MCVRGVLALAFVFLAATAHAQKPIGLFDCGDTPPTWATFCTIPDWASSDQMASARELSEMRGTKWLLQVGYNLDPRTPIGPHAAVIRQKFDAAGLLPHLAGMTIGEEWYEHCLAGSFAGIGVPAGPHCIGIVHYWLGVQQGAAKAALPLPVVWITTAASGPTGARPVPPHSDLVALDPYIPEGGTFDAYVEPFLAYAEAHVSQPLVIIPQWFAQEGYESPSAEHAKRYAAWLARPKFVALLGFTWQDRPWVSMRGLAGLPALRRSVEQALGVK
jgi:hypothetical protein